MKKNKLKVIISIAIAVNIIATSSLVAFAKPTEVLEQNSISVENNVGMSDVVKIRGSFLAGDVLTVYSSVNGDILSQSILTNATSIVTFNINQLGQNSGTIYVKLKRGSFETAIVKNYKGETTDPLDKAIAIFQYNIGKAPTLKIKSVAEKTLVKIYNKLGALVLTTEAKQSGPMDITLPNTLNEDRLSVTLTLPNKNESEKVEVMANILESTKEVEENNVEVQNNFNASDVVIVKKLSPKDVVKIYDDEEKGGVIGTATVSNQGEAVVKLNNQLVQKYIYVTVTGENKLESNRVKINVPGEEVSEPLNSFKVKVENNVGKQDEVIVRGLMKDDEVFIYWNENDKAPLAKQKVTKDGEVSVKLQAQIPDSVKQVYVSVARANKMESKKVKIDVSPERESFNTSMYNIEVANNVGKEDVVTVKNVLKDDTVNIYKWESDKYNLIGTKKANKEGELEVKLSQQIDVNTIYVTVTNNNCREGEKISVDVLDELISLMPNKNYNNIKIDLNVDKPDIVSINKLVLNDIVKVYSEDGKLLGQGKSGKDGKVSFALSNNIEKPFNVGDEVKVYVTVTSENKVESYREEMTQKIPYFMKSRKLYPGNVNKKINLKGGYVLDITGLRTNDVVKIYQGSGREGLIETCKASDSKLTVKLTDQFALDRVYITVKSENKIESDELEVVLPR